MRERSFAARSLLRPLRRWSCCALLCAAGLGIALDVVAQAVPAAARPLADDRAMLRVEAEEGSPEVFDVLVDGERVGTTPWEGRVELGEHIVQIANDTSGSMLTRVDSFEGAFEVLRLTSRPLGPTLRVQVYPTTAELRLEGFVLGTGRWAGRLPLGFYALSASERGYRRFEVPVRIKPDKEPLVVHIRLEVDPGHPRWSRSQRSLSWVAPTIGVGWTPSLGSGAEADCPAACTGHTGPFGFFGGVRAGYGFGSGISVELEAGYLQLDTVFDRMKSDRSSSGLPVMEYNLKDELRLAGPFVSGGVGVRIPLGDRFSLVAGLHLGVVIAASSDPVRGYRTVNDTTEQIVVDDAAKPLRSVALFVMPEIAALTRLGPFELGPVLRVGGFPLEGPRFQYGSIRVTSSPLCTTGNCTSDSSGLREAAYGPFVLISPQLRFGYVFH